MVGDEAGGTQDLHQPESSVASSLPWVLSGSSPPQDQLRLPPPLVGLLPKDLPEASGVKGQSVLFFLIKIKTRGFPGGPVVRTLSFHCRGTSLLPGQGTNFPHAIRQPKNKMKQTKNFLGLPWWSRG